MSKWVMSESHLGHVVSIIHAQLLLQSLFLPLILYTKRQTHAAALL